MFGVEQIKNVRKGDDSFGRKKTEWRRVITAQQKSAPILAVPKAPSESNRRSPLCNHLCHIYQEAIQ
jgi:hypothetical protein